MINQETMYNLMNQLVRESVFSVGTSDVDMLLGTAETLSDDALYTLMSDMYESIDFDDAELGVSGAIQREEDEDEKYDGTAWDLDAYSAEELLAEWAPETIIAGSASLPPPLPAPPPLPSPLPPAAPRTPEQLGQGPIRDSTLRKSLDQASRKPHLFCCVCCRILFDDPEEVFYCKLSETLPDDITVDSIAWPCYQYNTQLARKNSRIVACKTHRVIDENTLDFVGLMVCTRYVCVYG